jgi:hypothetical protein
MSEEDIDRALAGDGIAITNPTLTDAGKETADGNKNQPGSTEGAGKTKTEEQKAPEPKPEDVVKDIEGKLFGSHKSEDDPKELKRKYDASSKEAVRLNKVKEALDRLLELQGVEAEAGEDGIPKGLIPKKGAKGQEAKKVEFDSLPEEIKLAIESDPQKALDYVWNQAVKSAVKVTPDENYVPPLSEERRGAAIESIKEDKELDGEESFPGLEAMLPQIEMFLTSKNAPKELRELYNKHPALALKVGYGIIKLRMDARTALNQRETAKKARVVQPPLGPQGTPLYTGDAKTWADEMADKIANAKF